MCSSSTVHVRVRVGSIEENEMKETSHSTVVGGGGGGRSVQKGNSYNVIIHFICGLPATLTQS